MKTIRIVTTLEINDSLPYDIKERSCKIIVRKMFNLVNRHNDQHLNFSGEIDRFIKITGVNSYPLPEYNVNVTLSNKKQCIHCGNTKNNTMKTYEGGIVVLTCSKCHLDTLPNKNLEDPLFIFENAKLSIKEVKIIKELNKELDINKEE